MKKLLYLTVSLLLLTVSVSLKAQSDYTFTPIMDGRFYATEHNTRHTRGVINGELDPDFLRYYSENELKDYVVVPVAYEDIRLIKMFYQNGYFADQYSFIGVKDGTYTAYDYEGEKLLGPVSSAIAFQAKVLSLPYCFVATQCLNGIQGYDLNIITYISKPITVRGPFEYASYQEVKSGDRTYYVINAKKFGREEFAVYDVVGNLIPQDHLNNIADYYDKMGKSYRTKFENNGGKEKDLLDLYLAALCGEPTVIREVIKSYYEQDKFDNDMSMLADAVQDAEALYYVGLSYLNGIGTYISINSANSCFQKADKLGYSLSKTQLAKIAAIETPVKLATGRQEAVNESTDSDKLRKLAYKGNLEAIKLYCHQTMFFSFGTALFEDVNLEYITDEVVIDVLPLLLAGAEKDADCQFMLACVYGGREAMGAKYPDYKYSFRNVEKAQYWINRFKSNPQRDSARCWGYSKDNQEAIIGYILTIGML